MAKQRFFFLLLSLSLSLSVVGFLVVNAVSDAGGDVVNDRILFYSYDNGLGAGGYDVVAYFNANDAVPGTPQHQAHFAGVLWQFSSAANRDTFAADPARYIPQYGGHSAYAMAQGELKYGDPAAWAIHGDKLYFNDDKKMRTVWLSDIGGYTNNGNRHWRVVSR